MASISATTSAPFDPDLPARLDPQVALRPESFGALAYHFGTRRLVFVKSPSLVAVLEDLEHHGSARAAVHAHVEGREAARVLAALGVLHRDGIVDGR